MLTFADVIEALTGVRPDRATQILTETVVDVERVIPSALFVSLPNPAKDEQAQVVKAFERGAALAMVESVVPLSVPTLSVQQALRPETLSNQDLPLCLRVADCLAALQQLALIARRKYAARMILVTGSVGKTTTKDLIKEVLDQRFRTLKNGSSPNSAVEVPLGLLNLTQGVEKMVFEMELNAIGQGAFLDTLAAPHVVVVTNISTMHAAVSGEQAIIQKKANWLQSISSDGYVILNHDDPWVRAMAAHISAKRLTYGLSPDADLWADEVEGLGLEGIAFRLHFGELSVYLKVPLIGRHSVHTALRAAAVGLVEGLTWDEIIQGLSYGQTQLRLVAVHSARGALILDDTYNASPESTIAALNLLDEMGGRKIAVLGGMVELGPYDRQSQEMVGLRAAQVADLIVAVGERAKDIASAARGIWMTPAAIVEVDTNEQAVHFLRENLSEKDVVLVKGPQNLRMEQIPAQLEART